MQANWIGRASFGCLIALSLLAAGCETMGKKSSSDRDRSNDVVVARNVHGAVATYTIKKGEGKPTCVVSPGMAACPECDQAVTEYYETGKIEETCKMCGAKRVVTTPAAGSQHGN